MKEVSLNLNFLVCFLRMECRRFLYLWNNKATHNSEAQNDLVSATFANSYIPPRNWHALASPPSERQLAVSLLPSDVPPLATILIPVRCVRYQNYDRG